ncbi:MAG: PilX N-terminal domain-containing pilus assembly protein [Pseudomonadota bacterium]|nr:PilX N-terminal domain-containing pilus assembly protein [Pseudomonadota bacterium]
MKARNQGTQHRQRGIALITAMLLLIVVTIMALSMFRSYGTQERLAGNTRDKQRAINAAVSAQQFAESLLASGAAPATGTCPAGLLPSSTNGEVCNAVLPDFSKVPWTAGNTYTQFTSNQINGVSNVTSAVGTADSAGQSASYVQAPAFYITDLGPNAGSPPGEVYQVDALGYGGSANTVAVVESTFVIGTNTPSDKTKP